MQSFFRFGEVLSEVYPTDFRERNTIVVGGAKIKGGYSEEVYNGFKGLQEHGLLPGISEVMALPPGDWGRNEALKLQRRLALDVLTDFTEFSTLLRQQRDINKQVMRGYVGPQSASDEIKSALEKVGLKFFIDFSGFVNRTPEGLLKAILEKFSIKK